MVEQQETNIFLRIIYFLLIGWWFGAIIISIGYFLIVTIIGLPLGIWLIDRIPTFVTLRTYEPGRLRRVETGDLWMGDQYPLLWRALYFIFIGWWLTGIWLGLAYLALLTIILIPVSFWMFERVAAVLTLYRY